MSYVIRVLAVGPQNGFQTDEMTIAELLTDISRGARNTVHI